MRASLMRKKLIIVQLTFLILPIKSTPAAINVFNPWLIPAAIVVGALPDISVAAENREKPFGALFSIEPTVGLEAKWLVYHRVSAQYHIKAENTVRVLYIPFLRLSNHAAIGCGVGYFRQPSTAYAGVTIMPAVEFIHDKFSQITTTVSMSFDIDPMVTEKNIMLGFHFRLWEKELFR